MKITIQESEYNFDYKSFWGPLYIFEEIMDVANHPENRFNPALNRHLHVMLYSILLSDNEDLDLTIDDFLASLEDLELCNTLMQFYRDRTEQFNSVHHSSDNQSKKKTRKR